MRFLHLTLRTAAVLSLSLKVASVCAEEPREPQILRLAGSRCSCDDGRSFVVGSSLFGADSGRVVVTGVSATDAGSGGGRCADVSVAAQDIQVRHDDQRRPYLTRLDRRAGWLRRICETQIRF